MCKSCALVTTPVSIMCTCDYSCVHHVRYTKVRIVLALLQQVLASGMPRLDADTHTERQDYCPQHV